MSALDSAPLEGQPPGAVAHLLGDDAWKKALRWAGSDVIGDDSTEEDSGEVVGVLRELFEMREKSESSAERREALDEALEMEQMSGALSAWTFVVDKSCVGKEILQRSIVPGGNLKVASEDGEEASCCRLARLVKALASAIIGADEPSPLKYGGKGCA